SERYRVGQRCILHCWCRRRQRMGQAMPCSPWKCYREYAGDRRVFCCHREVEVMLVHWSPQRSDRQLSYAFPEPDVIEATLDGVTDRFDFSSLPDGELDVSALETTLDICPVLAARRVNGKL